MNLNVPPTKSNLLKLRQQLSFALEGFDLLEQKRQILITELMSRLEKANTAEEQVRKVMAQAFAALQEALLASGSNAVECAAVGITAQHRVSLTNQRLMGLDIPHQTTDVSPPNVPFGVTGISVQVTVAREQFLNVVSYIARLAELENAVLRVAKELRKTQRRCNALSKVIIPSLGTTITYIESLLEERDRESFVVLRMVRNKLRSAREGLESS